MIHKSLRRRTRQKGDINIPTFIPESEVEEAALEILSELDYDYRYGLEIAPETDGAEREDFWTVILPRSAA